jgi:hypothetical protein
MAVSGVTRFQGKQPSVVFYPFGHPTLYTCAFKEIDNDALWTAVPEKVVKP